MKGVAPVQTARTIGEKGGEKLKGGIAANTFDKSPTLQKLHHKG